MYIAAIQKFYEYKPHTTIYFLNNKIRKTIKLHTDKLLLNIINRKYMDNFIHIGDVMTLIIKIMKRKTMLFRALNVQFIKKKFKLRHVIHLSDQIKRNEDN